MDTKIVERHFGGRGEAIKQIGTYRQQWDYWIRKGIPKIWQEKIAYLSGGKLKAARK